MTQDTLSCEDYLSLRINIVLVAVTNDPELCLQTTCSSMNHVIKRKFGKKTCSPSSMREKRKSQSSPYKKLLLI